jgi:hypothetical protein
MLELDILSDWPEAEMLSAGPLAAQASTTMREAVRLAETSGGRALAAHVKLESNKKPSYVIELVEHGRVRLVYVDPESAIVRRG